MKKVYLIENRFGYMCFNSQKSALRCKKEILQGEGKIIALELLSMKDF